MAMDKAVVEFACKSRAPADIVNALTRDLDGNTIGNDMKTAVVELLNAASAPMCWLRDNGHIKTDFLVLAEMTTFEGLIGLVLTHKVPVDIRKPLYAYLRELPGFPADAIDPRRIDKADEVLPKFDFTVPRQQNAYIRSLFVNPAIKIGLMPAPATAPGAVGAGGYAIRPITDADRPTVLAQITRLWSLPRIGYVNEFIDTSSLPGFVAVENGKIVASLTWRPFEGCLHIVTLASDKEKKGIGTALLKEAEEEAKRQKLPAVLISAENSNISALSFYQKRGYVMHRVHLNVIEALRREKPSIPVSVNKIPMRDQIDFIKNV